MKNLNLGAIEVALNIEETKNILINIFADLKTTMEKVSFCVTTMSADFDITVNAKDVLLVLAKILMSHTYPKEL